MKFGQLLSTRPDIVPPDIIAELRALQDDVRPFPFEQAERVVEEELGNSIERLFLDFDPEPVAAASIGQVHRATLPERPHGGRQGAAARRRAPDRGRPRPPVPGGAAREGARARARLRRRARARRRVRAADPAGARLPARGAQRAGVPPQLRRRPARARPEGPLDVHAGARPHARMARRGAARRRRHARALARGAARPRVPRRRDLDDDDLPPRVLPRRPAPREHARPAGGGDDRPRRLRRRRQAQRRRHDEADTAVHRRRGGERRHAPEAPRRSRRALSEGSARRSSSPSCARSTTGTTARASPRSTPSR